MTDSRSKPPDDGPVPPRAAVRPQVAEVHGIRRVDDYAWLRDRAEPDVLAHLEAENDYTRAMMAATEPLRGRLFEEMVGRIQETDESAPIFWGDYEYYSRTEEGKQYRIYCRRRRGGRAEELLLDVNELAEGHDFYQLGVFEVSPDHRLLAYSYDTTGSETFTIVVRDLERGTLLPERIENTYYTLAWANDGRTFFYTSLDAAKRPYKIFRHRLGDEADADLELLHEEDDAYFAQVSKSRDSRFMLFSLASSVTTEVHTLDADEPGAAPLLFAPRRQGVEYELTHHGGYFYVRTNDGAENFRLLRRPVGGVPAQDEEIVGPRAETKLEAAEMFRDFMVLVERTQGLVELRIRPFSGDRGHRVELPESVYAVGLGENPEFETDRVRLDYTSLVTPPTDYDYDVPGRRLIEVKRQPVLGGYQASDYETYRVFAAAADGARIPVTLVHRCGLELDGSHPCLLYGYGSYGHTIDPSFTPSLVSLLERGFVYAIAHVRGGGYLGEPWRDAGRLLRKRNTFTDFVAAAEHLISEGYTNSSRLAIRGGSAGGLLLGAVMNLRPDLFAAAVAHVPFVDVVNTMLDETIPLTVTEYEEWGDPRQREYFEYMLSYSPYDNLRAERYPHLLVTAGLNDPRVQYWEPAKWVARLRSTQTGDRPVLLKTHMGAGHAGASGRYKRLEERAFEYAFVLDRLGRGAG